MDGARGDAVTGGGDRAGEWFGREAEAAVDDGGAGQVPLDAGEAIAHGRTSAPAETRIVRRSTRTAILREADVGRREVARAAELVAGDLVLA